MTIRAKVQLSRLQQGKYVV